MYTLSDLGRGLWQIEQRADGRTFSGSKSQVYTYAILNLGLSFEELNIAEEQMTENSHDRAFFGVLKRFIFTGYDARRVC